MLVLEIFNSLKKRKHKKGYKRTEDGRYHAISGIDSVQVTYGGLRIQGKGFDHDIVMGINNGSIFYDGCYWGDYRVSSEEDFKNRISTNWDEVTLFDKNNMKSKKKKEIETLLIDNFDRMNMDIPTNFEDILDFVYDDVCETADPINWSDGDVVIGFRRWIESKF